MKNKLNDILDNLPRESLVGIIKELHADKQLKKYVEQQVMAFDPKELAKLITKSSSHAF